VTPIDRGWFDRRRPKPAPPQTGAAEMVLGEISDWQMAAS
jgi:hypothetical protein